MKGLNIIAETKYRLSVILLDSIFKANVITEQTYDDCRIMLAHHLNAPVGLLEAEDKLWKLEK